MYDYSIPQNKHTTTKYIRISLKLANHIVINIPAAYKHTY